MIIFKQVIKENPVYKVLDLQEKHVPQADIISLIEKYIDSYSNATNDNYLIKSNVVDYLMVTTRIKSCYKDVSKLIDEVFEKRHMEKAEEIEEVK